MSRKRRYRKKKKERFSLKRALGRFLVFLFATALLCSSISIFINPKFSWIPMFLGLYFVPVFIANIVIFLILLAKRQALLVVPLIAILPSLIYSDRFVKFGSDEPQVSGGNVTVLSYNLGRFAAAGKDVTRAEATAMIEKYISERNPDIVCLQEYLCSDPAMVEEFLPQYPFRDYHLFKGKGYSGNLTLSRYPIQSGEEIVFDKSTNLCLVSDINLGSQTIRMFNCHLESYALTFTSIIKRLSNRRQFTDEFMQLHGRLREATVKRAGQVAAVIRSDLSSAYPSIICGDFNDTPVSYAYHQLQKSKKDSFVESGKGFSSTYSVFWPLLRIDYILFPERYECADHRVERVKYSDHYPIMTRIYYE